MNGLLGDDIDPRTQGLLALGLGLMQGRGNFGQAFGAAGHQALSAYQGAQDRDKRKRLQEQQERTLAHQQSVAEWQHEQARKQAEEAAQNQAWIRSMPGPQMQASQSALEGGGGPTLANAAKIKPVSPQQDLMWGMVQRGLMTPQAFMEATRQKAPEVKAFKPGEVFGTVDGGRFNELGRVPDKADVPANVREYEYAKAQGYGGTYEQWDRDSRKAGATNIGMPKIEVKMGESVAGQIGPMLRESRDKAIAGVKLVDSSARVLDAAERGNLYAGPLANLRLKAAQAADTLGIAGKDTAEKITNTRSVVRGMSEQAVAARSQLGGQAQISNSEQELLNKATAGDIGELTVGEVVQIANLNDRLGRQLYAMHEDMIGQAGAQESTRGLTGFYRAPQMPGPRKSRQVDGGSAVDRALEKYGGK